MGEPVSVTVYTVARWPRTAAAKRSAGYETRIFEFVAQSALEAINKAVEDCRWRDPWDNFGFEVVSSRVVFPAPIPTNPIEQAGDDRG